MSAVLEASGLCKDYEIASWPRRASVAAVRDVSLQLEGGKVVALVGESGSGKSTVARLLAGQERPSRGRILLEGKPVDVRRRRSYRAYKRTVQMIFQDPFASLNPAHTVRYHLQRALRIYGTTKADEAGQLRSLLEQVRLSPPEPTLERYPHELSGGQRQRVAIARALAVQPRVLLADEPVSMLDVSIRLEILTLLDGLRKRLGLAVLYITHDIASARYFADEILVMYSGAIVERGTAEQVTQHPGHPYTQLLLRSAPDPDAFGQALQRSPAPARTADTPAGQQGCHFSPRCPLATDQCRQQDPEPQTLTASHLAACWHLGAAAEHHRQARELAAAAGDVSAVQATSPVRLPHAP